MRMHPTITARFSSSKKKFALNIFALSLAINIVLYLADEYVPFSWSVTPVRVLIVLIGLSAFIALILRFVSSDFPDGILRFRSKLCWPLVKEFATNHRRQTAATIAAIFVLSISTAYFCRSILIRTNDLFHFGNYPKSYCYVRLNYAFLAISLDTYDESAVLPLMPKGWFFFHVAAMGGTWLYPYAEYDMEIVHGPTFARVINSYRAGRLVHRTYWIDLPYVIPFLMAATMCQTAFGMSRYARFSHDPLLCLACSYDLRGHSPGSNCPECGTPIAPSSPPASAQS